MGEANISGPQPGSSAGADETPLDAVPAQPAQPPQQTADAAPPGAAAADAVPSKKKSVLTFILGDTPSAIFAVFALIYLVVKLAKGVPVDWPDWVFTLGGMGLGARLVLLNMTVAGAVVLGWVLVWLFWGALIILILNLIPAYVAHFLGAPNWLIGWLLL